MLPFEEIFDLSFVKSIQKAWIIAGTLSVYYGYWFLYGRFQKCDCLPGPANVPLYGHYNDLKRHKFQLHLMIDEYYRKFGKIFSFFHQNKELKVISDENMVKEILVKQFEKFRNRQHFIDLPWPCHRFITLIKGSQWKYIRSLLSSVMTSSSLQNSLQHLKSAANTYSTLVDKAADNHENIDIVSYSNGYLMEILLGMAFSIDCPNQSELNSTLVELNRKFSNPPSWVNKLAFLPFGDRLVQYIPNAYKNQLQPFLERANKIVDGRKIEKEKKEDILKVLLDAQSKGPSKSGDILTDDDILAQGLVLLTAVHSQSSATLSFLLYNIAKHNHVQKKLQEEIDRLCNEEDFPSWDHMAKDLLYMETVIKEVLRLYPSSTMLTRECTEKTIINDITFSRGDSVVIPLYSMQRDEKVWEDSLTFNPERFEGKESSNALYSHGMGPRMCIGARLARLEMKVALCHLLKRYEFALVNPKQELSVKTNYVVQSTSTVTEPICVNITRR